MGSGKTTYMINYMKNNPNKKFFVVTPFLSEIERIIKDAPFLKEPIGTGITKSQHLYHLICEGNNIITTHAMFCKLNSVVRTFGIPTRYNFSIVMVNLT